MAKKLISGPIFARLAQIWAPDFFVSLFSTKTYDIQTKKNNKKPYFGSNLVSFAQIRVVNLIFFFLNHFRKKNVEQLQNERTQKM